jgi:hypothetical protein
MGLLDDLHEGRQAVILVEPDGRQQAVALAPAALLAGAFNPLHDGHLELARGAGILLNISVHFELCICNVDKPPLTLAEVRQRLKQFAWRHPVWVTRAPTFLDKARLFPGAAFVVGADTAERILAPRYYAGAEAGLAKALELLQAWGCRFLVAGRQTATGIVLRLADLPVPARFQDMFVELPADVFQLDISSSRLRAGARRHQVP